MKATLELTCTCGGQPYLDMDLSLGDAVHIRTWTMMHGSPGHVVTAKIVADPGAPDSTPSGVVSGFRNAVRTMRGLFLTH